MGPVLVINADLGPLHRVTVAHAIRMLCRRVAEIHEAEPDQLIGVFPMPKVVRLVRYVVTRWRYTKGPAWSKGGVLARDERRCGYCEGPSVTVDHILPRPGWAEHLAEHRQRVRALQPAQGRPDPGRGRHGASHQPGRAGVGVAGAALTRLAGHHPAGRDGS